MTASRLLVPPEALREGDLTVAGDDHHYLFRVRRLAPGAVVVVCDGAGREAAAVVRAVGAARAELSVGPVRQLPPPPCRLVVAPALIKGERMDWCVEKLVELGADEIMPVQTARCVVRLTGPRAERRLRRWEAIAAAASRQCRRAHAPRVLPVCSLAEALARAAGLPLRVVAWEGEARRTLTDALAPAPGVSPARAAAACVLVGPEGGFEPEEVEQIADAGFVAVSLGPRILRAETAAVAAAAIVGFVVGDLGRPGETI